MDKDDVLSFAKKAIPWIGAAATGNVPALVALAANAVSSALGKPVDADPTSISMAVAGATPEQVIALRNADNDFALKMKEFGYKEVTELYASEVADRNGARDREAKVGDKTNRNLAYLVITAFIAMVGCTLMGLTSADSVVAGTMIGYLSAKAEQILSYYFGSSRSSARKTELLATSTPGK